MMSSDQNSELASQVQALLVEALRIPEEQVTPELSFGDLLQWDSMGHMEVMMLLEAQFDIEINAGTIAELTSVPAICKYLQERNHDYP
jgi:acyl carrier protein